ncbi:MAG TPA: biopolymer transporter ExbB, partial [Flavobacteriaceae bacterium]|nr:biopolymer transporter ExbB [Flavobacteriaceae bacterium]
EAAQAAEPETTEKTLSVLELVMNGGLAAQLIIGVLFILLFVAVYIYFERLFAVKAASKINSNFMNQIRDHVAGGNIQGAKVLCAQQD